MIIVLNKRIPRYGVEIRRFVRWLNRKHPIDAEILLKISKEPTLPEDLLLLHNDAGGDLEVFGLFDSESATILLPVGMLDCTLTLGHLAHEYCHALQFLSGRPFDEKAADVWGIRMLLEYEAGF